MRLFKSVILTLDKRLSPIFAVNMKQIQANWLNKVKAGGIKVD